MKILTGKKTNSVLYLEKIIISFKKLKIYLNFINCEYIYFISHKKNFFKNTFVKINKLLKSRNFVLPNKEISYFIIIPRLGTLSSWSTKIISIIKNCGLNDINKIERGIILYYHSKNNISEELKNFLNKLNDKNSKFICKDIKEAIKIFKNEETPNKLKKIKILELGKYALEKANIDLNLSLNKTEIEYLFNVFKNLKRNPSDAELYIFSQANSEHCRHKIFNAKWIIDNKIKKYSLLSMIKKTTKKTPKNVISAYFDNSAIISGNCYGKFFSNPYTKKYNFYQKKNNILIKVETHNYPTALSPFSGSSTGAGGDIRDQGSTGCGSIPKVGLSGFSVSNLFIPKYHQPWEESFGYPKNICTALKIILEAPLGASSFNNEFGRPSLLGYFRTYEKKINTKNSFEIRGYHKPIMLSGGFGSISEIHVNKKNINPEDKIIVLGNLGMNVGIGGASSSSVKNYLNVESPFIQSGNPEIQRRCQEVINRCCELEEENPILFIHDVGAGGLSNSILEILHHGKCGGVVFLREILIGNNKMSPLEILCNESQERYVLILSKSKIKIFNSICKRENAQYYIVGKITNSLNLKIYDSYFKNKVVDLPVNIFFNKSQIKKIRKKSKNVCHIKKIPINKKNINLTDAINRVLHLPSVSDKNFLITIGDRSITGSVVKDQMVGPWQIPVSDCAVTTSSFDSYFGEAISIGERSPASLIDFNASSRLSLGEAITNISSMYVNSLKNIKLSANWMIDSSNNHDTFKLYKAVENLGKKTCPELDLSIVVGKDSMFMKTEWLEKKNKISIISPPSLIITACSPIEDVRLNVTPQLKSDIDNIILFIDLGDFNQSLGGTALSQVYQQIGDNVADLRDTKKFKMFFYIFQKLIKSNKIIAYHDRSDGGLLVTILEMAFAGHCSININLSKLGNDIIKILFNEELGVVIQIKKNDYNNVFSIFKSFGLNDYIYNIGYSYIGDQFSLTYKNKILYENSITTLRLWWSETTWNIQRLRDDPKSANQEHEVRGDFNNPGLDTCLSFDYENDTSFPFFITGKYPKVAILREQGTNAYLEMAHAFYKAGFQPIDIHMNDLRYSKNNILKEFSVLVACGGFSYGDVLNGGYGWAKTILLNNKLRDMFESFFNDKNTLSFGVCNGCQMMSYLREIIPGSKFWPKFVKNKSNRFESRIVLVEVMNSPSLLFQGMKGSYIPISVAHSLGRVEFKKHFHLNKLENSKLVVLKYVDNYRMTTEVYPYNPNGSKNGITAITNSDGRITISMPHPERHVRMVNCSWISNYSSEYSPWIKVFKNARKQIG
ncbi:purL [Wigglesworthia glossinidia endosymbiont of Glossina brevipalpis]|uniref:Phosphoribosylformylglycinamidine synthase n=1 Tax=Wigglesworthia glossinidia brevipalpis TaxID=36870 RepID=Q8D364_WIGBR|nr:purL [Wigglesworthia glossinidia endosymbiont of Glossina brevipalpis]